MDTGTTKTATRSDTELTVKEAGRLGGLATRATHEHEHYVSIGRLGGLAASPKTSKNKNKDSKKT